MDRSAFRRNLANGKYGGSLVSKFIYSVMWITSSLYHLFEMPSHLTTDILRGCWGGYQRKTSHPTTDNFSAFGTHRKRNIRKGPSTPQRTFFERLSGIREKISPLPVNGHFSGVWRPCRKNKYGARDLFTRQQTFLRRKTSADYKFSPLPDNGHFLFKW